MFRFKSLTAKFIFMSLIIFSFFAVLFTTGYIFTHHMKGEARKINLAGRQRMLTLSFSYQIMSLLSLTQTPEKEMFIKNAKSRMAEYEETFYRLRDGSKELGIEPLHKYDKESGSQLSALIKLWENTQKPALFNILKLPPERRNEACEMCHSTIRVHLPRLEIFVNNIEKHYDRELKDFDTFRYYAFGFFFVAMIFTIFFVRHSIVKPVLSLKDTAFEIGKGNFDVKVEVKTSDEIGMLSKSVNQMSQTLGMTFNEKTMLINDLETLYEFSKDIISELNLSKLLKKMADAARQLIRCKYTVISIFKEKEEGYEYFIPSVIDAELFEDLKNKIGLPTGKGLLGFLMREGKPLRVDDISKHSASIGFPEGHPPMKTFLGVPINFQNKTIGRIYFTEKHPPVSPIDKRESEGGFTQHDEDIAAYFANMCAVAINNAYNHRQVAMLAQSLESSTDIIVVTDINGRIIHVNPETVRQLGYSIDELVGQPVFIIQSPDNPAGIGETVFKKTMEGGWVGEIINKRKDSSEYPVLLTTSPVKDSDSNIIALIGIARDLTMHKQAEENLKLFKTLINQSNDSIEVIDPETGKFLDVNEKSCTDLGYSREELLSMKVFDIDPLVPPSEFPKIMENLRRTGSSIWNGVHRRKDGTTFPVEVSLRFVQLDRSYLVAIARDMTERKKAEDAMRKSEASLREAQHIAHLGSGEWDIVRNEMYWSEELFRILGLEPQASPVSLETFLNVAHPDDKEFVIKSINESLYEKKPFDFDHRIVLSDGSIRIVHEQAVVEFDKTGKPIRLHGTTQDITERKKLEDALLRFNEELMEKVKERTKELEIAKDMADNANRAKSVFLANMSHELRTPLNSIIGFSEAMMDGLTGELTDDQKGYLKDISESGSHLLSLINDILDLSKVEAGKMELELLEFSLKELIDGSLVMFKEKAMKHNIKLKAEVEEGIGNIEADERKIKQVIFNLLSNAMKFTPEGGSVSVQARLIAECGMRNAELKEQEKQSEIRNLQSAIDGNFIEISVVDTGIGISPEDQERLFQPFQQLETSYTKKYEGTGLGLNLCKKFVELHGGRIWVESEVGKGSRFVFMLPVVQRGVER